MEANKSAHGSAREWDTIWKKVVSEGSSRAIAFTRSTPVDIFQFWQRCYFEDLLLTIEPKPDWAFLELASGRGTTSMYLASRGFENITLLDLSGTALDQAKTNFKLEKLPFPKTVVGNAEETGLPANSFDCIYNIGVLEHFEDPSKILAESLRLLKPGGSIFMPIVPSMPFSHSISCRLLLNPLSIAKQAVKWLIGRQPPTSSMVRTATGCREYERIATKVGFNVVKCIPYNPYWKLHGDDSAWEKWFDVPFFRSHYRIKKQLGYRPALKTWNRTSLCLLLTGTKE